MREGIALEIDESKSKSLGSERGGPLFKISLFPPPLSPGKKINRKPSR